VDVKAQELAVPEGRLLRRPAAVGDLGVWWEAPDGGQDRQRDGLMAVGSEVPKAADPEEGAEFELGASDDE
jgi:hypothetical protein